jgi:hypothetical protein
MRTALWDAATWKSLEIRGAAHVALQITVSRHRPLPDEPIPAVPEFSLY